MPLTLSRLGATLGPARQELTILTRCFPPEILGIDMLNNERREYSVLRELF